MRGLAEDRNIITKPADKWSCIVLWDREDYLAEADKQLQDVDIYGDTGFMESDLVKSQKKSLSIFSYQYIKSTNFGKIYLLPNIHKRLDNVPGCPVISNCGTPTEKASKFLNHHLQPIMKSGVSYIKDNNDFLFKLKNLGKIPETIFLVTTEVAG